jgi:hypothetical protein
MPCLEFSTAERSVIKVGHHRFFQVYESLTAITISAPLQRAASASR